MAPWASFVPEDRAAVAESLFREVAGVRHSQEGGQAVGYQGEISAAPVREAVELLAGGVVPSGEGIGESDRWHLNRLITGECAGVEPLLLQSEVHGHAMGAGVVETAREIEMPVVLGHRFTSRSHGASGPTRGVSGKSL